MQRAWGAEQKGPDHHLDDARLVETLSHYPKHFFAQLQLPRGEPCERGELGDQQPGGLTKDAIPKHFKGIVWGMDPEASHLLAMLTSRCIGEGPNCHSARNAFRD